MSKKGIGSHTKPRQGSSDDWITPPHIVRALGEFDLDPCASDTQPWPCAKQSVTRKQDGLTADWVGRVWLNPPYSQVDAWLARLAEHGRGTALVFARTETDTFAKRVWSQASAILFLRSRVKFHFPDGAIAVGNSGGPSVLIAYGKRDAELLKISGLSGAFVSRWSFR